METLDRVIELQQQGKTDSQIMEQLRNEGISPSVINDTINQARVKSAISLPEMDYQNQSNEKTMVPSQEQTQEMQPSIMPIPQQSTPQTPIQNQQQYQNNYSEDNYYTPQPQAYPEQAYYPETTGYGTETISEIAEQVATEKLEDYKSKIGDIVSFKHQTQAKINDIDDRLKRIENSIDKLQQAILGKIGEFGEANAMIHQDLNNLHGTVSKLMNPLIDNINEIKKFKK